MKVRNITLSLLFVLFSSLVYAGGFQINEHGARSMAMGGAFTAVGLDASAVYFNPAAITKLPGLNVMVGTTLIAPNATFTGASTGVESKVVKRQFFPSHAYVSYNVDGKLSLGIGFLTPFGLGTEWDANYEARYSRIKAEVKTFSINPTVAYKVMDNLSVGFGVQYNWGSVNLTQKVKVWSSATMPPTYLGDAFLDMNAKDNQAFGVSLAALWDVNDKLELGLSYRSAVTYNFSGNNDVTLPPTIPAAAVPATAAAYGDGEMSGDLVTPKQLVLGGSYKFTPNFLVTADFQYIGWSSYDRLVFVFKSNGKSAVSVRDYKNTFIVRAGAEYNLSNAFALRGGLLYDKNPIKDEYIDTSLPDANRIGISVGCGYKLTEKLTVDAAYLALMFADRTITNSTVDEVPYPSDYTQTLNPMNGKYTASANLFSLSLSYAF